MNARSPFDRLSFKLFVLLAAVLLGAALAAALLGGDDDGDERAQTAPLPTRPAAPPPPDRSVVEGETDRELLQAQRAARRFVRSYLPVLYGRAPARTVTGATPALRADLRRNVRRLPPAMLERTPRLERLDLVRQAGRAVQATATIADGDVSTYPLIFYLEQGPRGWRATSLGDD